MAGRTRGRRLRPMQSKATTVAAYLATLPAERRAALAAVRKVILANLDHDYEEGMGYGMISYHVPHRVFPDGYHCDPKLPLCFAGLASQKNHMSLYLMTVYGVASEERRLRKGFAAAGKKLDMGKSCIRFKRLEDLPLDVIGEAIRRVPAKAYIAHYVRTLAGRDKPTAKRGARTAPARKKSAKAAAKKRG